MIWKEFLKKTTSKLAEHLEKDVQYSNLPKSKIRHIAGREIEIFIQDYKKWAPEDIILNENNRMNKKDQEKINKFVNKRKQSIPLAYIVGQQEFYGLSFKVDKNTLIPRPETEELVERALNFVSKHFSSNCSPFILIDIGTGSGCVITSIIKHLPANVSNYQAYGIDVSGKALKIAGFNVFKLLGKKNKIKFIKGSLLDSLICRDGEYPISTAEYVIIANLPYLSEKEYKNVSREVRNNEPKKALVGGPKGHELICKLLDQVSRLKNRGVIFLELSPTIFSAVKQYCATLPRPSSTEKFTDINGKGRIMQINF